MKRRKLLHLELLLSCYESGFRFYDSAREYGESEVVVGEFLKEVPRNEIFRGFGLLCGTDARAAGAV